ncbi:MAG: hypothetical protein PGN25_16920 [Methylorubrum populi]
MPKPHSTPSRKGRRPVRNSYRSPQENESTAERRRQLAISRFTYSGGYDGYEGRMILSRLETDAFDRKKT